MQSVCQWAWTEFYLTIGHREEQFMEEQSGNIAATRLLVFQLSAEKAGKQAGQKMMLLAMQT